MFSKTVNMFIPSTTRPQPSQCFLLCYNTTQETGFGTYRRVDAFVHTSWLSAITPIASSQLRDALKAQSHCWSWDLTPAEETEEWLWKRGCESLTLSSFWISIASEYPAHGVANNLLLVPSTTMYQVWSGIFCFLKNMDKTQRQTERLSAMQQEKLKHAHWSRKKISNEIWQNRSEVTADWGVSI